MPRVRLELTAFRLWDWRAAYCATEAGWKPLVVSALFFGTNYFWLSGLSLSKKTAMSFDKAVGRPSNKNVPKKKQATVKVPWYAAMIKASKASWEFDQKAKIFMPRVRLELTAFRLWDWRAAYCATEATRYLWTKCVFCSSLLSPDAKWVYPRGDSNPQSSV